MSESFVPLRGLTPMQGYGRRNRAISPQPAGQAPARALCGVAALANSSLLAAHHVLQPIPIRGLRGPVQTMNRLLNVSPVFAEPVAEAALGMAIDLARGISSADRKFRCGIEEYGLAANKEAFSLYEASIGFVGMGDLGRAILPLLKPFRGNVRAYDPWLPPSYLESIGCRPATLEQVLQEPKIIFVVAGVTSENQGFLNASHFSSMQSGAALVLVSRAGVVDFDALLDAVERGHIRAATDVFPQEPLPPGHRARTIDGLLLSPHQAGALSTVLRKIGQLALADIELMARHLPPMMCKLAQPETVGMLRSKPVNKS